MVKNNRSTGGVPLHNIDRAGVPLQLKSFAELPFGVALSLIINEGMITINLLVPLPQFLIWCQFKSDDLFNN